MFMCVRACAHVCVCVCVSVLVWTLTDCDCISIGFSPSESERESRAQTEKWDQGGNSSPLPRHSPFQGVWSHTHTYIHCECCPLLLGVLASLMRCERGTEMEQLEEEKEVDQRNGARGGSGVTINLVAG